MEYFLNTINYLIVWMKTHYWHLGIASGKYIFNFWDTFVLTVFASGAIYAIRKMLDSDD